MVVDLKPLLRGVRGDAFRIARVVVGDRATKVDPAALTGAEEAGKTIYRRGPDGVLFKIPLAERTAAVVERGGWLRCGQIDLRIADGCIERMVVRGPSLASLNIRREGAIQRRFGPAAGRERRLWQRLHHYPDRALVVVWNHRESVLDSVELGPDVFQEPQLGADALLGELLHLAEANLVPGAARPHGATGVHYDRASALARALGLGSVADVAHGQFLTGELTAGRQGVLAELEARCPYPSEPADLDELDALRVGACTVFASLLRYRRNVERLVRSPSDWVVCSDPALLGMIETQRQIAREFKALLVDVDRWLCTLMAPDHRTFALRDLIAHHAWPDVDLDALERIELAED